LTSSGTGNSVTFTYNRHFSWLNHNMRTPIYTVTHVTISS
jgi:hypothetical protein